MSRILIYDSGVGNRPIASAINQRVPGAESHLLSDTAFFPYGEKTDDELINRTHLVLYNAVKLIKPDILVLACNTLSTIALDAVRESYSLPVVGVVPAIKPAAAASDSKVIGLLATPATINRRYTENLIAEFAADCDVLRIGSTDLVKMAELYVKDNTINMVALAKILAPLSEAVDSSGLDQLVLGCTHFPLLKTQIQEIMTNVGIQDSSAAIGRQVSRILSESPLSSSGRADYFSYATLSSGQVIVV